MRNESEILDELSAAKAEYHEAAETKTRGQLKAVEDKIVTLTEELANRLSVGSKPCPQHPDDPVQGMLRRPEHVDGLTGQTIPPCYEVGCRICGRRSVGNSPDEAVEKWNAGKLAPMQMPPAVPAAETPAK